MKTVATFLTLACITVSASIALSIASPTSANAFNPERIIDDGVFTNYTTMNTGDIQNFLNSKVPHCDTNGDKPSEYGGGTRRQYAASKGISPPFTCIKDYSQNGKSAAQIINDAAQEFQINPQVLIVLMQKEQGLITDDWPWPYQYRSATGYGCPDSAACNNEYYGLTNQVRWAARMFRAIMNDSPTWWTTYELGNNSIAWHPDTGRCGHSTVNIQNRATQALYNYSPYRPNQAALDAGYGMGDSCSSYGNRNFYLFFRDWFGSVEQRYAWMSPPRWMVVTSPTRKVNLINGEHVDNVINPGYQIRFIDKMFVNGKWYLRTETDRNGGTHKGILVSDLGEIPYTAMSTPKWMRLNQYGYKQDPRARRNIDNYLPKDMSMFFNAQIIVNGNTYYRTETDTDQGYNKGIPANALEDLPYENFSEPRWMQVKNNTTKSDPRTRTSTGQQLTAGTKIKFTSKILTGKDWYYRTEADQNNDLSHAVYASDLMEIPYTAYRNGAYCLQLKNDARKIRPTSGVEVGETFVAGRLVCIGQQITIDGITYYRSDADVQFGLSQGFRASDLEEVPYEALSSPRWLIATKNTTKVNPKSGEALSDTIAQNDRIYFTSKVLIRGKWYFRTQTDSQSNADKAISTEYLREE